MEHLIISGGEQYLPFARSRIKALRALGRPFASQKFEIEGCSVHVRIEGAHEFITLNEEAALWVLIQGTLRQEDRNAYPITDYNYSRLFCITGAGAKLRHSGATRTISNTTLVPNGIPEGYAEWMSLNTHDVTTDIETSAFEGADGALTSVVVNSASFVAACKYHGTLHSETHWFGEGSDHGETTATNNGDTRVIAGGLKVDVPLSISSFRWDDEGRVGYVRQVTASGYQGLDVYPYVPADPTSPPNIYSRGGQFNLNYTEPEHGSLTGTYDGDGNFTGLTGTMVGMANKRGVRKATASELGEIVSGAVPQSHVLGKWGSSSFIPSPEVLAFSGGAAQAMGAARIRAAKAGQCLLSVRPNLKSIYRTPLITAFGDIPYASIFKADLSLGGVSDEAQEGKKFFDMSHLPWRADNPIDMKMKAALTLPYVPQSNTIPGFVQGNNSSSLTPWTGYANPFYTYAGTPTLRGVPGLSSIQVSFFTRANRDTTSGM